MIIENKEEIFKHFEKYIKLSDTLKGELAKRIIPVTFSKGELVHDADKVCTKSYFIQKGLMRVYFMKDGKEISEYFPLKANGVIHQGVLGQGKWTYTLLMR